MGALRSLESPGDSSWTSLRATVPAGDPIDFPFQRGKALPQPLRPISKRRREWLMMMMRGVNARGNIDVTLNIHKSIRGQGEVRKIPS